jgi:hypothetical protein
MPGKINVFNLGALGVDIVKSPLHVPDGAWLQAQNAEFPDDEGEGGIKQRGALTRINASALAGAVQAIANMPFPVPADITRFWYVGLDNSDTDTWLRTSNGTTFAGVVTPGRGQTIDKFPVSIDLTTIAATQRAANYNRKLYYPSDDYVFYDDVGATSPLFSVWDGTVDVPLFRIPINPTSTATAPCRWITDVFVSGGLIYLAVWDEGGAAPNHKGRVIAYDPENGTLLQVGNRFGDDTGENNGGMPFCLATFAGFLFAGTYGISGSASGRVWRIRPGIDEVWTSDLTEANNYIMSMGVYKGNLYVGTSINDSTTAAKVKRRTPTGTWSNSDTGTAGPGRTGYYCGPIVFDDLLFMCYFDTDGGTPDIRIRSFDGTTWSDDKDVQTDWGTFYPAQPFVFANELYWPFIDGAEGQGSNGFIAKRTAAGVWSQVVTGEAVRGLPGTINPLPV